MEEEHDKWNIEGRTKDLHLSPSCSSFEVLDPHDPTISRLATQLFKRTNDYLQGEMAAGQLPIFRPSCMDRGHGETAVAGRNLLINGFSPPPQFRRDHDPCNWVEISATKKSKRHIDHYTLLEEINRMAITKYADLRNLAANLSKTLNEYNDLYHVLIKPLLLQIDHIDAQVSQFEANAYRLDSYTKQLRARYKELEEQ